MVNLAARNAVGRALSAAMPWLLLQAGCAEVLDVPSDPRVVKTGPWRCVNSAPRALTAPASDAEVRVRTCDFITDCTTDVTGLTAKLCDKRDVGCNQPRQSGITDANGEFKFRVPTAGGGFDGYLRVDSPLAFCTDTQAFGAVAGATLCGLTSPLCDLARPDERCYVTLFAPAMLFFNPPIVRDVEQPLPLQMFPSSGLPAVIAAAGIQIDPAGGSLFLQALDCDGVPASGVSFEVTQHRDVVQPLYVDNGVVSSTAPQTDATGVGGFVGVPPGFATVVAHNSDGVEIGQIGLQAAASILTYGTLAPSPSP
ncbi:MAG TPA: hypothetical protein VG937_23445 [Polyangiaceae bacterium]|jgi:hypothetical protein|nr:hypothetical protein [Polyangiaceae bacterium]